MRVLAITNLYPSPYHPHRATFNRQQLAAMARQHEVRVIAPIAWTDEWAARRRKDRRAKSLSRRRLCDGMLVEHPRYLFTPKVMRGLYGHFVAASVRNCFMRAVSEFEPDVVLGCWAYPDGWAAVRLAREAGLPVVIKAHGSDLLEQSKHPARLARTREALASADAVVAVSAQLGQRAIELGSNPEDTHVVYNGVDGQLFTPGSRAAARQMIGGRRAKPFILFVGNLVPVKGVDVLIDALAALKSSGVAFEAALVGQGPLRAELQRRVDERGLLDCVRFVGPRPLEELPAWYRAADLLVLPSLSEGVPNVVLEALSCATPVVASRVGGTPEILGPDALVPPGDVGALAEKIGMFLASPPRVAPCFMPGTWDDSARALASVLEEVVSARRDARAA